MTEVIASVAVGIFVGTTQYYKYSWYVNWFSGFFAALITYGMLWILH